MNTIHQQAYRAVSTRDKTCEGCGSSGRLHRHHEDYAKPLDVELLCPACHGARHRGRRHDGATLRRRYERAYNLSVFEDRAGVSPSTIMALESGGHSGRMDGERLRYWRLARVMTLKELAVRSGVGASALSEFERGKRRPHPKTIGKLAQALGVEPRDLLKHD